MKTTYDYVLETIRNPEIQDEQASKLLNAVADYDCLESLKRPNVYREFMRAQLCKYLSSDLPIPEKSTEEELDSVLEQLLDEDCTQKHSRMMWETIGVEAAHELLKQGLRIMCEFETLTEWKSFTDKVLEYDMYDRDATIFSDPLDLLAKAYGAYISYNLAEEHQHNDGLEFMTLPWWTLTQLERLYRELTNEELPMITH